MNIRHHRKSVLAVATLGLALAACAGHDGKDGATGPAGVAGTEGAAGEAGAPGSAGAGGAAAPVSEVVLPGNTFFPESVASDATGKLYVSSAALGSVVTISPDGRTVEQLVAPEIVSANPFVAIAKLGVLPDEARKSLWVCTVDTSTFASTLRRYELATGEQKASLPLANPGGVCNDLALDAKGNLYVTDSFFGIERLPAGGTALEVWKHDPLFTAGPGQFAVDGIVVDGGDVYANNLTTGALVRVPIGADGAAGPATAIQIKDGEGAAVKLAMPDGMRLRAARTLLVAESGADAVSELKVDPATDTAVREVFANRIDRPSSVAVASGAAWIAEGQIGRLFALEDTPVNYPFMVKRVPLH